MNQEKSTRNATFRCLAHPRRRKVLSVLLDRSGPIPESDLVTELRGGRDDHATDGGCRTVAIALSHNHLPKLEEAGLIERVHEDRITATDHPVLRDRGIRAVLQSGGRGTSLDALFEALAAPERRHALSILERPRQPLKSRILATGIAVRTEEASWDEIPEERIDRIRTELEHVHLPKLVDAELVERDENGAVTYRGHPELRTRWLSPEFGLRDGTDEPARASVSRVRR